MFYVLILFAVLLALTYGMWGLYRRSTSAKVSEAARAVGDDITDTVSNVERGVGRVARGSHKAALAVADDVTVAVKGASR